MSSTSSCNNTSRGNTQIVAMNGCCAHQWGGQLRVGLGLRKSTARKVHEEVIGFCNSYNPVAEQALPMNVAVGITPRAWESRGAAYSLLASLTMPTHWELGWREPHDPMLVCYMDFGGGQ